MSQNRNGDQDPIPDVSVVVPVYNGRATIGDCIESLLAQDYPADHCEVIIVDNNSTDGTPDIVAKYPATLLYEREIQTSYAARNRGIRHAQGEIVAFTDADCIAESQWLRELVRPFSDPDVGGVGGEVLDYEPINLVDRFLHDRRVFGHYQSEDTFLPILLAGSTAYRRECLTAVGLFNANLYTAADIDLSWRVQLQLGVRVCYAPAARVWHRHRNTLKGMFLQHRRHAFGSMLLTTMYKSHADCVFTPRHELTTMAKQMWAMLTYVRSFAYRSLVWKLKGKDTMYIATPALCLVAESGALWGRVMGLWATRFFRYDMSQVLLEDPGER